MEGLPPRAGDGARERSVVDVAVKAQPSWLRGARRRLTCGSAGIPAEALRPPSPLSGAIC